MSEMVVCNTTAWVSESQMVRVGELYNADDPVVKDNPKLFTTNLASQSHSPEPVKRGPGRPPKIA